jgi:hypothetical protein
VSVSEWLVCVHVRVLVFQECVCARVRVGTVMSVRVLV